MIDETVTPNCKSGETKLQGNVQGAKGEPGAKGEDGADGGDGIAGPTSLGSATGTIDNYGACWRCR